MMTDNEAIIMGKIAQNMRSIKSLAGLLKEDTTKEVEEAFTRYHFPVAFQDFIMMEDIILDIAARHGHRDIKPLVDLIHAELGAL